MFIELTRPHKYGNARPVNEGDYPDKIEFNEDFKKHLDFRFEQINYNEELEDVELRSKRVGNYPAKLCTEEDFGEHPKNKKVW